MDLVYKVRFADNVLMSAEEGTNIGWGKDLISYTLDFVNSLREINMDLTEFCILNAIILTYPGKCVWWGEMSWADYNVIELIWKIEYPSNIGCPTYRLLCGHCDVQTIVLCLKKI